MVTLVYILCALTSTLVTVLLLRGWSANRAPQLLWTGIAFAVFAVSVGCVVWWALLRR